MRPPADSAAAQQEADIQAAAACPDGAATDPSAAATAAVERAGQLLRGRRERMTRPRRAVLSVLARDGRHLSADQVVSAVAGYDASVHRASVYRALEALSGLGVVQHVHLGHGSTTYALAADRPHLHGHCSRCGTVVDLPGDLLDDVAARLGAEVGFALDPAHVALSGTCERCSGTQPVGPVPPGAR
jgi:Fe2+ or Zn2+ uptake regulation protein